MPSIHIPENTWAALLMQHDGDRDKAREAVKQAAKEAIDE
jgi:hypothetical protein